MVSLHKAIKAHNNENVTSAAGQIDNKWTALNYKQAENNS